jgi:hypothetical protein
MPYIGVGVKVDPPMGVNTVFKMLRLLFYRQEYL